MTVSELQLREHKKATRPKRSLWDRPLLWYLPALLLLALVTLYPLGFVLWMSLHETRYYEILRFVGTANFGEVFASEDFRQISLVSLAYVFGSLALALPVGMAAAVVFQELGRFAGLFRVITLLPWTLSMAVVASLWLWLLNPSYGPVGYVMQHIGFAPGLMLGDPDLALWFLVAATAWWSFPYVMVMASASLQSVPKELYEAVHIDGGGFVAAFRAVTWPHLLPTMGSTALNLGILYLTVVTLVLVLTGGGPLGMTTTWSFQVFRGTMQAVNIGPAAVYSVVVLVANLGLGLIYVRSTGRASG